MPLHFDEFITFMGETLKGTPLEKDMMPAYTTTRKFYCKKLLLRSACDDKQCAACILHLQQEAKSIHWASARKPIAVFQFKMKHAVLNATEAHNHHVAPQLTPLGEVNETDALDLFMETL